LASCRASKCQRSVAIHSPNGGGGGHRIGTGFLCAEHFRMVPQSIKTEMARRRRFGERTTDLQLKALAAIAERTAVAPALDDAMALA
jgi:hypothetical protein